MQTTGFKVNEQRRQRNDKAQDCKGHEVRQATFTADTRSLFGVTDKMIFQLKYILLLNNVFPVVPFCEGKKKRIRDWCR